MKSNVAKISSSSCYSAVLVFSKLINSLRTVPTFAGAHTVCASCQAWCTPYAHAKVDIDVIN